MQHRNSNGLMLPVGSLDPACPEAQWWSIIVGSLDVPLKGPVPVRATGPAELAEPQAVYLVDMNRLTEDQIEGICKVMSAKFDVPIDEVRQGIRAEHGLPIRADRIRTIAFDARMVL